MEIIEVNTQEPKLIVPASTPVEAACLDLDAAIDTCLAGIQQMQYAVKFLKEHLENPIQLEALNNIEGLIDEAMLPYLSDIDDEFKYIADV
jgi:hypothetical protein